MLCQFFRAISLCILLVPCASAESSAVVTLISVGERVRVHNPDLAAARFRIQEAAWRINQSGRLSNPELATSLEHDSRLREGKFEIGLSQRFPVTDRLRLEKEISRTELKAAGAEVREMERELIGEAREAVVKVLAARQHRELLIEQMDASKQFADFLTTAAARGESSPVDAGQAKLEAASIALEMRQLIVAEAALAVTLKPLLGMQPGEALSVGGKLPEPAVPRNTADVTRRPDLQVAKLEALAAEQMVGLEQARRYDDVEGGFFAAAERREDVPEGIKNEIIIGVQFKITLPFWSQNEGAIQEAEAKRTRKEMEATALASHIRLEADAARSEMQEWAKMIGEISETLLPLADSQAALAESIFRKGQGGIQAVFQSREKRLQLAVARLEALREFHLACVRHQVALAKP